jgi:hypothetical protein
MPVKNVADHLRDRYRRTALRSRNVDDAGMFMFLVVVQTFSGTRLGLLLQIHRGRLEWR